MGRTLLTKPQGRKESMPLQPENLVGTNANVELVKNLYACFGRGDIPAILAALDENVEWIESANPAIPYSGTRRGKAAVGEFFKLLGQVNVTKFEPLEYVSDADRVLVIGRWSGSARTTGKSFSSDWIMDWKIRAEKSSTSVPTKTPPPSPLRFLSKSNTGSRRDAEKWQTGIPRSRVRS